MPSDGTSEGRRSSMVLGPKDRLKGNLFVEGNLVVVGTVDGELEATGDVEIDRGGRVNGPVTARNRLVVGPSGSLLGDVRVARLVVEDGATFSGNVSMIKPGEAAKAAPAAAKEPSVAATEVAPAPIKAPAAEPTPEPPKAAVTPETAEAPKAVAPDAAKAPKAVAPDAAKAPKAPAADVPAVKKEAWQLVRPNGKRNDRKGRHR